MKLLHQAALGLALLCLSAVTARAGGSGYIPGTMGNCAPRWGLLGGAGQPNGGQMGFGPYRPFGCGAGIYSAPWYLFIHTMDISKILPRLHTLTGLQIRLQWVDIQCLKA